MSKIKINGIEVYYEIAGNGPNLTLIMGLGCSARQWQWMVPVFADSFRVIVFDNRGVGRSDKPDMEYTTELFADDTYELLKALAIEKTHLCGASMGGMIAQKFALKYPEIIDKLVLGCTMPNPTYLPPAPDDMELMQQSQLFPSVESVEKMMRLFLSEEFYAVQPDVVEELKRVMVLEKNEQGEEAFFRQLGALLNHNTLDELGKINVQTLVISGEKDPVAPVANARLLTAQIPNSTLAEITDGYHAFWVERYEEACAIIRKFLTSTL